jgi:hypothetical protein
MTGCPPRGTGLFRNALVRQALTARFFAFVKPGRPAEYTVTEDTCLRKVLYVQKVEPVLKLAIPRRRDADPRTPHRG